MKPRVLKRILSILLALALTLSHMSLITGANIAKAQGVFIEEFQPLDDEIRYQRGFPMHLILPDALMGTISGDIEEIPVEWECETDYAKSGLHVFTAKPANGYTSFAELPKIAFLSDSRGRIMGSGTMNTPLEITNAS